MSTLWFVGMFMDMSFCESIRIEKGGRNLRDTDFERLEPFHTNYFKSTVIRRISVLNHEIPIFSKTTHYIDQLVVNG